MRKVLKLMSIMLSVLMISSTIQAVDRESLLNEGHLWEKLDNVLTDKSNKILLMSNESNDGFSASDITYKMVKKIGKNPVFEHYQAYWQDKLVIDGRIVVVRNKENTIIQAIGSILTNLDEVNSEAKGESINKNKIKAQSQVEVQDIDLVRSTIIDRLSKLYTIKTIKFNEAVKVKDKDLLTVYQVEVYGESKINKEIIRQQYIFDSRTLDIIEQTDLLNHFSQQVKAGGIGGNAKMGHICYSPEPMSMTQCKEYSHEYVDFTPEEALYATLSDDDIFSEFDGYPFIVTKEGDRCRLENNYVITMKSMLEEEVTEAYVYDCMTDSNEHFDKYAIDNSFVDYFSYSALNDAHFNAGVVIQMYYKYLAELFPDEEINCNNKSSGYCLRKIMQKTNITGSSGGAVSNAFWDGTYVNYGNGDYGNSMYSTTVFSIVAHEITHGVTEWNSDLGSQGQAGALNEGFSDIAAIAGKNYLNKNIKGTFSTSEPYVNKMVYHNPGYSSNRFWWYAWDAMVSDRGVRYFEVPSIDGVSIDDARDYLESNGLHANGGVLRKFFYELVAVQKWSIEDAFKLILGANISCWRNNISFDEAASCLLLQANSFTDPSIPNHEDQLQQEIDSALLSVGLYKQSTNISYLDFDSRIAYDTVYYSLPKLNEDNIEFIDIDWGDGSKDAWKAGDDHIDEILNGTHSYEKNTMARIEITVKLFNIDKPMKGYRTYFMRGKALNCNPYITKSGLETRSLLINNQEVVLIEEPHQIKEEGGIIVKGNENITISLDNNTVGKIINVFVDANRDGLFKDDERLIDDKILQGNTIELSLPDTVQIGFAFLRIAISTSSYSENNGCGALSQGQVIDVLVDVKEFLNEFTADFTYQSVGLNTVQFTSTSKVPNSNNLIYSWNFGDGSTSNQINPKHTFNGDGYYDVSLQVKYTNNGDEIKIKKKTVHVNSSCSDFIENPVNAGKVYIKKLNLLVENNISYSYESGFSESGYMLHNFGDQLPVVDPNNPIEVEIETNSNDIGYINGALPDTRLTVWVDSNDDGYYDENESNYFDSKLMSVCDGLKCYIKGKQEIYLPLKGNYEKCSWYSLKKCRNFNLRVRLEVGPEKQQGIDACNKFKFGEVEDFTIRAERNK